MHLKHYSEKGPIGFTRLPQGSMEQKRLRTSFLEFYLWGHVKSLVYVAPFDNEEARHHRIGMPVRLLVTTPASLNGYNCPWWEVSRSSLNDMEDIPSTYYKPTLSARTHKLNVSGHMLIWTFFIALVCGTRAQVCLHLLVTLCIDLFCSLSGKNRRKLCTLILSDPGSDDVYLELRAVCVRYYRLFYSSNFGWNKQCVRKRKQESRAFPFLRSGWHHKSQLSNPYLKCVLCTLPCHFHPQLQLSEWQICLLSSYFFILAHKTHRELLIGRAGKL
jgi:hypothetical protein